MYGNIKGRDSIFPMLSRTHVRKKVKIVENFKEKPIHKNTQNLLLKNILTFTQTVFKWIGVF